MRNGDFPALNWARVARVLRGRVSSEGWMSGYGQLRILLSGHEVRKFSTAAVWMRLQLALIVVGSGGIWLVGVGLIVAACGWKMVVFMFRGGLGWVVSE